MSGSAASTRARTLLAVPAHNEAESIRGVAEGLLEAVPGADLLVVDDDSRDGTREAVRDLPVRVARHRCNLGYGRAVQTALKYAAAAGYQALVTVDADGQHDPAQVPSLLAAFEAGGYDLLVGSRYCGEGGYAGAPLGRRMGMTTFSLLVGLFTGQRIRDTTSGFRVMRRSVFTPLTLWHFVDFHAEALVYLLRLGFKVGEHPVAMRAREHGESMYSLSSAVTYPAKTSLMVLLALAQAQLSRRRLS